MFTAEGSGIRLLRGASGVCAGIRAVGSGTGGAQAGGAGVADATGVRGALSEVRPLG